MPNLFNYIASLQQHNALLAILCQHVDIKASIFLSLVAVTIVASAFGSTGNSIVFVMALAFAAAYPLRMGARMLASRPASVGGTSMAWHGILDMGEKDDLDTQRRLVRSYGNAIRRNTDLLRQKNRENKDIIITSLLLFGYMMAMTAVVGFIESPGAAPPLP